MGIQTKVLVPFTTDDLTKRDLIIKMLQFEDSIMHSDLGFTIYSDPTMHTLTSLESQYVIQRMVLVKFGFDTTVQSLSNYRLIGKTYYNGPTDYDKEVINSITYLRENRLLFYTTPIPQVGDVIPNCDILNMDEQKINLHDHIRKLSDSFDIVMLHAFSTS